MDFDGVISVIHDDEELQPGQLYFELPLSRLKQPLQAVEMAALAVKASSALMKSGGDKCRCRRKSPLPAMFSGEKDSKSSGRVAPGGGVEGRGGSGEEGVRGRAKKATRVGCRSLTIIPTRWRRRCRRGEEPKVLKPGAGGGSCEEDEVLGLGLSWGTRPNFVLVLVLGLSWSSGPFALMGSPIAPYACHPH
ncbi:hypothetical protein AAG906_029283 [Vitis piasezkii]